MGKQMLIYVIGLSMITAFAILNLNKTSLSSQDTFSMYYSKATVHNIALAGANIGTNLCLADTGYKTNLLDQGFTGGHYSIYISKVGDTTKVTSIGRLPMRYYDLATGAWKTEMRDTIESTLKKFFFSRYGYFSDKEDYIYTPPDNNTPQNLGANWMITGDSLFGPVHTNGNWNLWGSPYFGGKVTAKNPPVLSGTMNPKYNGGYQWGITIDRPLANLNNLENAASVGGKLWTGSSTGNKDIGLEFSNNGNVRVKIPWNGGGVDTTYASIQSLAPNGVIGAKGIDIRVKGTYKGTATVFARTGSAPLKGNIWFQGDLTAATNPQTNPNSTDKMGLVAERMSYITTTGIPRNESSKTYIQASIYTHNGTLAVENYDGCGKAGQLNLYGGSIMKSGLANGVFDNSGIVSGMSLSTKFDNRFLNQNTPFFPAAAKFQLFSWWEN